MAARYLALLLAACGRIGFGETSPDSTPDGAACLEVGHDEDLDGVDDACDLCPQLAGNQDDRDGDRVGDGCDPHPDDPIDKIAFFDPFTSQRPEWEFSNVASQPTFTGDSFTGDGRTTQFRADLLGTPPTIDSYTVVLRIGNGDPNPNQQRQFAFYALESDPQVYFCDLDDNPNGNFWAQSFTYNGTNFSSGDATSLTGPLENGLVTVRMDHDLPANSWSCTTTWPVGKPTLTSPIPPPNNGVTIEPIGVALGAINLEIEVFSFFHVHSD